MLELPPGNISGKKILLRIDINSAIINGRPVDSSRFRAHGDFLKELIDDGARIAILAHQGRRGKKDYMPSLRMHAGILGRHIGKEIKYYDGLFGRKTYAFINSLGYGEAVLLENVRNYNEDDLGRASPLYRELCRHFDLYVNDAFSVSHRKQASIILPAKFLESYAGKNLISEYNALSRIRKDRKGKMVYLLGGEKFEDFFPLFKSLKGGKSKILASGVLGNAFLIAKGYDLGCENEWMKKNDYLRYIPRLRKLLQIFGDRVILPVDFSVGSEDPGDARKRVEISLSEMPSEMKIWDVGKITAEIFKKNIKASGEIFMKGPLGFSEIKAYSNSTIEILGFISELTRQGKIFSVLTGGHLAATIKKYKLSRGFSYISLSGGAAILFLAGRKLPGLEALKSRSL